MTPACGKVRTLEHNDYALDLVKLHLMGHLDETERRSAFMSDVFQPYIERNLRIGGYDHRLTEMQDNWKIFEDSGFVIFCGSVAKSDNNVYAFVWVLEDMSGGNYVAVFLQVGKTIVYGTEYPSWIVPRRLTSEQAEALNARSKALKESE